MEPGGGGGLRSLFPFGMCYGVATWHFPAPPGASALWAVGIELTRLHTTSPPQVLLQTLPLLQLQHRPPKRWGHPRLGLLTLP